MVVCSFYTWLVKYLVFLSPWFCMNMFLSGFDSYWRHQGGHGINRKVFNTVDGGYMTPTQPCFKAHIMGQWLTRLACQDFVHTKVSETVQVISLAGNNSDCQRYNTFFATNFLKSALTKYYITHKWWWALSLRNLVCFLQASRQLLINTIRSKHSKHTACLLAHWWE